MSRSKRYIAEQIIRILREAEIYTVRGQTCYRWRKEYGGINIDQAGRLKDTEKENQHLRKAVSDLTPDRLIPEEALSGKH
jgi:hypothetical protein